MKSIYRTIKYYSLPMEPLVTIAIPTYNRADKFLKESLRSACSQDYPNLEIIVADNCSEDGTEYLVKQFQDKRIRYYKHHKNVGPFANMNFCVNQANGEYLLMLHDDDMIDSDFIKVCMDAAMHGQNIFGIIMTGARIVDETGKVIGEKRNIARGLNTTDFIMLWYSKRIYLFLASILFYTRGLKEIGGFRTEYDMLVDVAAEFELAARYGRLDIPEIKASFRDHTDSHGKGPKISRWCDSSLKLVSLASSLINEQNGRFYAVAMKTSSDRMYRYASRYSRLKDRMRAYLLVWKKFNFRYYPSRKNLVRLFRPLSYVLYPIHSIEKLIAKTTGGNSK
jgi:glycosyltransferase involved in cell wall biosynthesis